MELYRQGSPRRAGGALGRALSEYALLAALIALGALPALGVLSEAIGAALRHEPVAEAPSLFGLISPGAPSGAQLAAALQQMQTDGGELSLNMAGDRLQFTLNGVPLGGASDTTGAQGDEMGALMTRVLADQFLSLASQVESAGGDATLAAKLRALAQTGHQLAQAEETVNQAISVGNQAALTVSDPADPASLASQTYTAHWQWTDQTNQLIAWMEQAYPVSDASAMTFQDPLIHETFMRLNAYAEGIDAVGAKNFVENAGVFQSASGGSAQTLAQLLGKSGAANAETTFQRQLDVSGVTMALAPAFTDVTASRLAAAQNAAKTGGQTSVGYLGESLPN